MRLFLYAFIFNFYIKKEKGNEEIEMTE